MVFRPQPKDETDYEWIQWAQWVDERQRIERPIKPGWRRKRGDFYRDY